MEKLFENKTIYNKNTYLEFLKFHNKKFNLGYNVYTIIWSILFIFCIIISFNTNLRIQGVLITIILVSFLIYRILRPNLIAKKEMSSEKITTNSVNKFKFYDKEIKIINNNGSFTYKYFSFRRIYETEKYFYIYVTKENAFVLSKKAFSLGTSEDFAKFMKKKCGWKFKPLKNK